MAKIMLIVFLLGMVVKLNIELYYMDRRFQMLTHTENRVWLIGYTLSDVMGSYYGMKTGLAGAGDIIQIRNY